MDYETVDTDVLIIGAGGAGCRAAIEAANRNINVTILCKELFGKSSTVMAEGGYNAVLNSVEKGDSWQWHFYDTVKGGAWINDQRLVEVLVKEAPDSIYDLEEYGAIFDRTEEGRINQRRYGKQTHIRTCFVGDRIGHEVMATLVEEIRRLEIQIFEEFFSTRLLVDGGKVVGVVALDIKNGDLYAFRAKSTILASGGGGRIFEVTTNARGATGDGYALGYNAGATLLDMEMVQFHPTGMVNPESHRGVLVTEALRSEGALLFNKNKERFMERYEPKKLELAGRDEVAAAIAKEILEGRGSKGGGVYLDATHIPPNVIESRLPTMLELFLKVGIDIRKEPVEVAPTVHHFMGGLLTDEKSETSLKGLYAAGEATGGIHGANRLGGNGLAGAQVFGRRAGAVAAENAKKTELPRLDRDQILATFKHVHGLQDRKEGIRAPSLRRQLQNLMWGNVGIFRTAYGLTEALEWILRSKGKVDSLYVENKASRYNWEWVEALEVENMLLVAEMVVRGALERKESRGAHRRQDFPNSNDEEWWANILIRNGGGEMQLRKRPATTLYIKKPGVGFDEVKWS
jgi:fumarate reductase (CoM/CoB) subunit A